MSVAIKAVGLAAPGLAGWADSTSILDGTRAYLSAPETTYAPALLPPNERRRATAAVKLAFRAAEDAVTSSGADARELPSVFASSDADMSVLHRICAALAQRPRLISPTDFHNSVHNAASGYWSIGVGSKALTTTLSAHDSSFVAGLLETIALVRERTADVLFVTYDVIAPPPLAAKRPLAISAGVALILGPTDGPHGSLETDLEGDRETICDDPALESLRVGNPALRALPLLSLIAARRAGVATLRGTGGLHVAVRYAP